MTLSRTVTELAKFLGGVVQGDGAVLISGLAALENAGPESLTFLANPKYASKVAETSAGAVLMLPGGDRYGRTAIEVSNPYLGFAKLLTLFYTSPHEPAGVLPGAIVCDTAVIGTGASGVQLIPEVAKECRRRGLQSSTTRPRWKTARTAVPSGSRCSRAPRSIPLPRWRSSDGGRSPT